jgi:galactoside 2-L-fucosyltransferase 1/2
VFIERQANAFDGRAFSLNFMHNIYLDGYFQSWRYFDHVRTDLHKQFTFPQKVLDQTHDFLTSALNKHRSKNPAPDPVFVGVHIRRGDYLSEEMHQQGYTVATAKYFDRAMKYFESRFKSIVFVVTSDDIQWCQENIGSEKNSVVFSRWLDLPSHDLCLLSKCNHTILSVGTFGWWGAWLANGDATYYKDFPLPRSSIDKYFKKSDYYLPNWIAV